MADNAYALKVIFIFCSGCFFSNAASSEVNIRNSVSRITV